MKSLPNCHDCGAKPGQTHSSGCDVERCSSCGTQRLGCDCSDHDPKFSRWTGLWPGKAEIEAMKSEGLLPPTADLNSIYSQNLHEIFLVKPK